MISIRKSPYLDSLVSLTELSLTLKISFTHFARRNFAEKRAFETSQAVFNIWHPPPPKNKTKQKKKLPQTTFMHRALRGRPPCTAELREL